MKTNRVLYITLIALSISIITISSIDIVNKQNQETIVKEVEVPVETIIEKEVIKAVEVPVETIIEKEVEKIVVETETVIQPNYCNFLYAEDFNNLKIGNEIKWLLVYYDNGACYPLNKDTFTNENANAQNIKLSGGKNETGIYFIAGKVINAIKSDVYYNDMQEREVTIAVEYMVTAEYFATHYNEMSQL